MNSPSALDPTEREELERLRLEAPAIQARRAELEANVRSTMLELEVENDDLRRQLAERADTPAASLDLLHPESRAEFDKQRAKLQFAAKSDMEALAACG